METGGGDKETGKEQKVCVVQWVGIAWLWYGDGSHEKIGLDVLRYAFGLRYRLLLGTG